MAVQVPDPLQRPGEVSGTASTRLHKGDEITGSVVPPIPEVRSLRRATRPMGHVLGVLTPPRDLL